MALIFFRYHVCDCRADSETASGDREDYGSYQVMTIFANIGFMGYPLLDAMYGGEAVIHAANFLICVYSVLIYTYGINRMKTSGQRAKAELEAADECGVISCLIAVTLYISNLPVPMVFKDTATRIGAVTGPLSMLVIGDSLSQIRLKDFVYGCAAAALFCCEAAAYAGTASVGTAIFSLQTPCFWVSVWS